MFESLFTRRAERTHQFTVYRSGEQTDLEGWLTDHGVEVVAKSLPHGGPEPFIEITTDGEFVGVIGIRELESLLEPPVARPIDSGVSKPYRVIFDVLDDTLFQSLSRRELLAVSREIEERAYRVGKGTLRVSFQALSTFQSQVELYRVLATESELDIHIYGSPDWTPPEIAGITYHEDTTHSITQYWSLAYDGGLDQRQMCALVAKEDSDRYQGWWTNDPETVSEVLQTLKNLSG